VTLLMICVVVLTVAGVFALWSVLWAVNTPTAEVLGADFDCDGKSPDGRYRCMDVMAHPGWCHNNDIEWRYDCWAIGSDDYTRQDSPPRVTDAATVPIVGVRKRLPKIAIVAGVLAILVAYNLAYDTVHPKQAKPKYHCEWNAVRCENWTIR
jgi:hypothetical protein